MTMIFGMIILALVAGVAFYHFVQGFFSAMISAVLVLICAMVAVSYHEPLAEAVFASVMPNFAHAVALVGLFAVPYVVLRMATDRLVPGNIRIPVIVDKVGAAVFGVIAGVLATGVLAIAAQLLPMGPDLAGYGRYATADREVTSIKVPGKYQRQDLMVYGEMTADSLEPGRSSGLFPLEVDDMTLTLASHLSSGSLAGDRSLTSVHPAYLDELFGQRLGPAKGADVQISKGSMTVVSDVYTTKAVLDRPEDFEAKIIRGNRTAAVTVPENSLPVVVRATVEGSGGKNNGFNMGSVRLVVGNKNFYPIGSYQRGQVMLLTRPDDTLYVEGRGPVDFVFMVEADLMPESEGHRVMPAGSYIEVHRGSRASLEGKALASSPTSDSSKVGIVEKKKLED